MSDLKGTVTRTPSGFHVEAIERMTYNFTFLDGVFNPSNHQLADLYHQWGRCLAITDINICALYGPVMQAYFTHYNISVRIYQTRIGEQAKNIDTMLAICGAMQDFGIIRKEPVLVVGGGLITDVAGFACAVYRRNSNYIRIPTTVIGLIDASVSIKVAVNLGKFKNRLGAYHAPIHTFLDFSFLRTLPEAQIRNGFAELIKISTCADLRSFELLDKFCEALITTGFARKQDVSQVVADWTPEQLAELRSAADEICDRGIHVMLQLETPNLHELDLDRVIAYGHTWSPTLELAHDPPLRHGHAISVDMAYSATLGLVLGVINKDEHDRILKLFSRAGLAVDDDLLDEEMLRCATEAILKTRDGKLRAAVPSPLGQCMFLNDEVDQPVMAKALRTHKEYVKTLPREGRGIDSFVPRSEMGENVGRESEPPRMLGKIKSFAAAAAVDGGLEAKVRVFLTRKAHQTQTPN